MTLQVESFAREMPSDTFNYRQLNAQIMLDRMSVADVQLTKDSPKLKHDPNLGCWLDVLYDGRGTALAVDAIRNAIAGRMGLRALWACPRCRVDEFVSNRCKLCGYMRDVEI